MSSIKRSHNWLCVAAFAAAFWITLRVMAAPAPPVAVLPAEPTAADSASFADEIRDPALDLMLARFANTTGVSAR